MDLLTFSNPLISSQFLLSVLNVVAMLFMPESPVFYVSRSDDEAARNSLIRLRGKEYSGVDQVCSLRAFLF